MEIESEEKQKMIEEGFIQGEQSKTLQDAGEVIFKRLESKGALFHQKAHDPIPIQQRRTNSKFVVISSNRQYKTYQINDNQLRFESHHTIEFPVFSNWYYKTFSEDHLHYFFDKNHIEKRENSIRFFQENSIEWGTRSWLTFGFRIGIDQPERINPYLLGESNYHETGTEEINILDIFDNQKPLLNQGICLLKVKHDEKVDHGPSEASQVYYVCRFDPKYPDFTNHLFRFNLKAEKLFDYQQKLITDFEKLSPKISKQSSFFKHSQCFNMENEEPGTAKRLMPFTQVDNFMIIVGLMDMRKRTVPIKRLISMYELLNQLEFKHTPSVEFFNIVKIDYCVELDMLILDAWMNFYFESDDRERIYSVLVNEIEARVARRKLGFLSEINDGRIKEVQKLRFKVWGLLKSRRLEYDVDILGYRGSQSFCNTQGMVATFDEGTSGIRLCIFSSRSKSRRATPNGIQDTAFEKQSQKVVKEDKGIKNTVIEISKVELLESRGIRADGIILVQMVNQNHLLVTTTKNLLLFDIKSAETTSCLKYSQNIPTQFKNTKIYHNIMVSLKLRFNLIELFQISKEGSTNRPCFEFLGILDFSNCVEDLFEVDSLVAFKQVEDEVYELIVVSKMIESPECAIVRKMLFLVQFRLPGPGDKSGAQKEQNTEIIYITSISDVDFSQEDIRAYNKNDLWNYIFFDGVETSVIQNNYEEQTQLRLNDLHRFKTDHYRITNVHIDRDLIFIEFTGEKDKLLKVVHASREDEDGELVEAELERTISLDLSAAVYFDEVTDLTRIFILEKNEGEMSSQLTVISGELEEVEIYNFPWFDDFIKFKVINFKIAHIIARDSFREENLDGLVDKDLIFPNVSLLLDLQDQTFQRLIVEGEGPLLDAPHLLEGGQLLAFRRDYSPLARMSSDGIYYSNLT